MFIYFSKPFDIQEPVVFICVVWFFARLESRAPCSPKEELQYMLPYMLYVYDTIYSKSPRIRTYFLSNRLK